VGMKMPLVVVSNENVLVFLEAKLVQRVQGGINPLCARWTFSWRPCQFIVEDSVVAAWITWWRLGACQPGELVSTF
jgi:hypothetical protein